MSNYNEKGMMFVLLVSFVSLDEFVSYVLFDELISLISFTPLTAIVSFAFEGCL